MDAFILDAFTLFKRGGNRAISVNPPDDYIGVHITTRGSDCCGRRCRFSGR